MAQGWQAQCEPEIPYQNVREMTPKAWPMMTQGQSQAGSGCMYMRVKLTHIKGTRL